MGRAVIVCGAKIEDYELVSSYFKEGDFFIYCDSGLIHEDRFLTPVDCSADLIVGDFDSYEKPDRDTEIIALPREKDDTDSVFAVKEALKRGFDSIVLVGAIGGRLDHTLVNAYALLNLYNKGIDAMIVDNYSEMIIVGERCEGSVAPCFDYFSLIALEGPAKGVTITGAKFPLDNGEVFPDYQYATSNEVMGDNPAKITIKQGKMLLIKVRCA